jgi:hypothetical protein
MPNKKYTEQIIFQRQTTANDGGGGVEKNGLSNIYTCLAEIEERQFPKMNDASNPTFRNYYKISIWKDPSFEPLETDIVSALGKNLTIQEITSDDFKMYFNGVAKR